MSHVNRLTTDAALLARQPRSGSPRTATPSEGGLRIAVFASEFPALSETFVLRQVVALIERGHDVTVFADHARAEPLTHTDFDRHGIRARTRYIGMPTNRGTRALTALGKLFRHGPRHPRLMLDTLNVFRHGRDAANLRRLYWAAMLLEERPFDVLHCHFGPVGAMIADLRERGAVHGHLATTFHGADLTAYLRDNPEFYRSLMQQCDLALPISDYLRHRLIEIGCPPERISVLHMGVDTTRFAARPEAERSGPLRLLSIGRLIDKKGFAEALQAVAVARRTHNDLNYTIIGDGPLRQSLERLARDLGIEDAVEFRGWQVQEVVVEELYTHHVMLAPSVTGPDGDQEGIPVTLMEAMATGMPVISTWHSGIPELVEDGVCGFLAAEHDHDALANSIEKIATSPGLAQTMGRTARARVQAAFDATVLDDQLDRELRLLASQSV